MLSNETAIFLLILFMSISVIGMIAGFTLSFLKNKTLSLIGKSCLVGAVSSLIGIFIVVMVMHNQQEVNNTDVAIEQEIDYNVTFDEIYRAYKENELRADDTYKNNRYEITAKINSMATNGLFNLTGGATLTMEKRVGNTIVFFYAEFEKEQEENLKKINVGDTITFIGECLGAGSWVECELIID